MPIFCTDSRTLCIWVENGLVTGQYVNNTVQSTSTLTADHWTSVVFIYDETGKTKMKKQKNTTLSEQFQIKNSHS
jgi:hypothetical protein